ncbi:unnamed protein product [Prunus brigantina]
MSIYKEGETKMWVVHEDGFDTMNMKNAGLLEVANLSFDEPKLEAIMFSNNNEEMLEDVLGSFSVGMLGRALLILGPPYSGKIKDFKAKKVREMVVMLTAAKRIAAKESALMVEKGDSQGKRSMVGSVGIGLFPSGNRECLKNISFVHPHERTPNNGLGLWCSQAAQSLHYPRVFVGFVDLRNLPHHNPSCKPREPHDLGSCELGR